MRIAMKKKGERQVSGKSEHRSVGETKAQQHLEWARQFETVLDASNLLVNVNGAPQWAEEVARTTIKMVNPPAD